MRSLIVELAHILIRLLTRQIPNGDGTFFTWFEITSFPKDPPLLIAEGGSEQGLIAAA